MTTQKTTGQKSQRTKKGIVKSAKMQNTIIVTVESKKKHPKYHKQFSSHNSFAADTNGVKVEEGDAVIIAECKPLSKTKRWKLVEVIPHK